MPALPATFRTLVNLFTVADVVREKLTLIECCWPPRVMFRDTGVPSVVDLLWPPRFENTFV